MGENFKLRWNDHHSIFFSTAEALCQGDHLTDVTLSCGKREFSAHKLVLSICSTYFNELFTPKPGNKNRPANGAAIVYLKDVNAHHMELLLNFMYRGEINVEEDDAEVKWYKDGVEIIPDGKRIKIVKEGKKRKLVIDGCKLEDAGNITAKTNADESSAPLNVAINNQFVKGMREFKQCVEREQIIFNVEVKDPNAPVDFFINGEQVYDQGEGGRVEIKDLGEGKRQLIINKAEMPDNGTVSAKTPSNKGDQVIESKSAFTVIKVYYLLMLHYYVLITHLVFVVNTL